MDSKTERHPLVGEKVNMDESSAVNTNADNEQYTPVDYVQVRGRRRKIVMGTVLACCLGACLAVAVAVPVMNAKQNGAGGSQQAQVQTKSGPLMMMMQMNPDMVTVADEQRAGETTTPGDEGSSTTSHEIKPTWRPWWWNVTFPTRPHFHPFHRSTTPMTPTQPGPTKPSLPETCPRLPPFAARRVELSDVTNRTWYELIRVQTYSAPAYADRVSCSALKIDDGTSGRDDDTDKARAFMQWRQRILGTLFKRESKNATLHLHRADSPSQDWLATVNDDTRHISQFSIVGRVGEFLATYECFPGVERFPNPGYVLHVYTTNREPGRYALDFAESLLGLVERWGLNPLRIRPEWVGQYNCDDGDDDVDYIN
jgi:hypothetical protein